MESAGEIQVPLYLLALREVLGREPVAGLLVSIRRGDVRGVADGEGNEDVLPAGLTPTDVLDHATFEEFLESARALAAARIERIREGDIRHDAQDPSYCAKRCEYAGICRVAR
jgi:hypothetical protein